MSACSLALGCKVALAEQIRVAVASNFSNTITELAQQFENDTGHHVSLLFGSTGKHYAQIIHGAPYHAFFAADTERPTLLEQQGHIVSGSRFTYAIGQLVLWSPNTALTSLSKDTLSSSEFRFLAIANPRLAPYGKAAQEVLEATGQWQALDKKLVRGENIAQTFQFVQSGNAEFGMIALSQANLVKGAIWHIPSNLYQPIQQQAVLLKENKTAEEFLTYVQSETGRSIITSNGYKTPQEHY